MTATTQSGGLYVGPIQYPIWPEETEAVAISDVIKLVRFPDMAAINKQLRPIVLAEEARQRESAPPPSRAMGGQKLRRPDHWDDPAFNVVHARAQEVFRRALNRREAHADGCWINVYRHGESIGPHSHRRVQAAIVYMLDLGDEDPDCPVSGNFAIVDPRMEICTPMEKGCLSHPCQPKMTPGTFVIFPAQAVHYVPAYFGQTPRITVSWNMADHPIEGSLWDAYKGQTAETG
mgnify:CR=1 FL=1